MSKERLQVSVLAGLAKGPLWLAVLAPPVFVLFAMQHSAITVPFWDHCELANLFIKFHDGPFQIRDLWATHNHSRPFTYRSLLLVNGLLTDWDIRSEYVYMLGAIYGAFLVQALALWRAAGSRLTLRFLALLSLLSIFSFSPVGHNNHWWSMMIQPNLAHFFIALALTSVALGATRWRNNVVAGVACWLATYTLTNGLVAFISAAAVAQLGSGTPRKLTPLSLFWLFNIALIPFLYFPGLAEHAPSSSPGVIQLAHFMFIYLGAPLGGIIRFPFSGMFDLPRGTTLNTIVGIALCAGALFSLTVLPRRLKERTASGLLFAGYGLFAFGSSILTGWGRAAFDDYGVANANASRYTIFSCYFLYGVLFLIADSRPETGRSPSGVDDASSGPRRWAFPCVVAGLILMAGNTYVKAIPIYRESHEFNKLLQTAYATQHSDQDRFIYPRPEIVQSIKSGLRRLRIGPYRSALQDESDDLKRLAANPLEDMFMVNGLRADPKLGHILFAHPRSQFELPLSGRARSVSVAFGILDAALHAAPPTDGVEFALLLQSASQNPVLIWSRYLDPVNRASDRGIQRVQLSLSAAEDTRLIFETLPGPTTTTDWAYWADLVIATDDGEAKAATQTAPKAGQ